jgi:hypothetical protein
MSRKILVKREAQINLFGWLLEIVNVMLVDFITEGAVSIPDRDLEVAVFYMD